MEESTTTGNCDQSHQSNSIFEEFEMAQTSFSSIPQVQESLEETLLDI